MSYPTGTPAWRRYLRFWKKDARADVDAEIRFHFDCRVEDLMNRGRSRTEAEKIAVEEFGDVSTVRADLVRIDERLAGRRSRLEWAAGIAEDARYAARSLARTPAVTLTILVALAIGLGVNAAMFSFLDQVFARKPAGVAEAGELRRLWWVVRFGEQATPTFWPGFDYGGFAAVREAVGDRASMSAYRAPTKMRIARGENAPEALVSYVGPDFFRVLGVVPAMGRLFLDAEQRVDARTNVAVVSDAFWMRTLGGAPDVIGRTLRLNNRTFTIVGVTRPGFSGIDLDAADVWIPFGAFPPTRPGATPWWQSRSVNGFQVIARLAAGATSSQVEDRATTVLRARDKADGRTVDSVNVARLGSIVKASGPGEPAQEIKVATRLAGVAAIVLVIACANVINLLLARAVRRRREIAVRLALGVSRARLMRLLIVESTLIALAAAVVAIVAANWAGSFLRSLLLPGVSFPARAVDWRVAAAAMAIAVAAGLLAGVIPAWQASRPDLTSALKAGSREGGPARSRTRSALVIAQAALSIVLLAGAGLFLRSLQNVHQLDIGFDVDRLVFAEVSFDTRDSIRDRQIRARWEEVIRRLESTPGVERVALSGMRPMYGFSFNDWFVDKPLGDPPSATYMEVSPSYFETTGLRIIRGTGFPDVKGEAMPRVVVVNRRFAESVWPGENPVGRCMRFESREGPCYTIVGVSANAARDEVVESPAAQYYLPIDRPPTAERVTGTLVVRAAPGRRATVAAELRTFIRQTWPAGEPRIVHMTDALEPHYRPWALGAKLFTVFGLLALVIAAVGIYSTVAYSVTQRTHEFGVRVALGARTADVLRQVLGDGLRMVAVGVMTGIVLALAAGRFVASLLYGIQPGNPAVIACVGVILLTVAALAALLPAWRAARVDPVNALRSE